MLPILAGIEKADVILNFKAFCLNIIDLNFSQMSLLYLPHYSHDNEISVKFGCWGY